MKNNLQGGDYNLNLDFYKSVFKFIKNDDSLLNFGSGKQFNFEKELKKIKNVSITSVDIINIEKRPEEIDLFLNKSVEDEINFEKKFDVITFFELIEHIDKTDQLLINCYKNLEDDGLLIFSFPNLSSIYSRIELLLGFQPHILEISNYVGIFGTGFFGKFNSTKSIRRALKVKSCEIKGSLHHIRGITTKAMKEMLDFHGFEVKKIIGSSVNNFNIFSIFPSLSPVNIFICKKKKK